MIARLITALDDLTRELLRAFPSPVECAIGSSPVIAVPEALTPGLVPCVECATPQRPGAVHFPSNTAIRPCVGSWRRR